MIIFHEYWRQIKRTLLFTLSLFRLKQIVYPSPYFPYITTASSNILQTIFDFNQIEELVSRHQLDKLIKHLPQLNSLITKYNLLFVIPSQIHILILEDDCKSISIDNLFHTVKNVKRLEISINSKDIMLGSID